MKWRKIPIETPYIGQYCFVKHLDRIAFGIYSGKEFCVVTEEIPQNQEEWAPAFYRGLYKPRNLSGELDFVPSGVYDEDGNILVEPPK